MTERLNRNSHLASPMSGADSGQLSVRVIPLVLTTCPKVWRVFLSGGGQGQGEASEVPCPSHRDP